MTKLCVNAAFWANATLPGPRSHNREILLVICKYPGPAGYRVPHSIGSRGHSPSQFEEINRLLEETDWRGEAEWNRALEVLNEYGIQTPNFPQNGDDAPRLPAKRIQLVAEEADHRPRSGAPPVARAIARSTQPAGYRLDRGLGQSKAANSAFGVSFDGRVCNCFSRKHALSNNFFGPVRVFVFDKPEHDHFA